MALLADIIVPEIFVPYAIEKTAEKSLLLSSALVERNPALDILASGGGNNANMPFFTDLSGDDLIWDEVAETPGVIQTGQDAAVIHYRKKAWNSSQLARYKSGDDPMAAIADHVADYWGRRIQQTLISTLVGVFASTTMANEQVNNVSIADGDNATAANLMSRTTAINTMALLDDEIGAIGFIFMHSTIYWNLARQEEIQYIVPSEIDTTLGGVDGQIPTYLGKIVIVDNSVPAVPAATSGMQYTTIFAGAGAIGYGEGQLDPGDAVKTDEDILAGTELISNWRTFILHPFGVRWIGTPAGASPTNAELEAAANWNRVYERRNVRLAAAITNG